MLQKRDLAIVAKSFSWQALGLLSMTAIGYITTGSLRSGGTIAGASALVSLITYVAHEKAWDRWLVKLPNR